MIASKPLIMPSVLSPLTFPSRVFSTPLSKLLAASITAR
jgi:hypothetical protein